MATFNTKQTLYGSVSLIPAIAEQIKDEFQRDGFEVKMDALSSGGYDISITKGGTFKAVLGMKTALKVTLLPLSGNIDFEAGVGIWGQQAIPTVISMFFFWPVLITQMWGMIEQSQLDDRALAIAQKVISGHSHGNSTDSHDASDLSTTNSDTTHGYSPAADSKFCTHCGTKNPATAKFCCGCGREML